MRSVRINGAIGRPRFNGKSQLAVLQKLEEAFMLGSTDVEACIYAGISSSAFYEYQKANPLFLERKTALKNLPSLRAKKTIVDRLTEDVELAKWWLTKKHPNEFGERREQVQPLIPVSLTEASIKTAEKYIVQERVI